MYRRIGLTEWQRQKADQNTASHQCIRLFEGRGQGTVSVHARNWMSHGSVSQVLLSNLCGMCVFYFMTSTHMWRWKRKRREENKPSWSLRSSNFIESLENLTSLHNNNNISFRPPPCSIPFAVATHTQCTNTILESLSDGHSTVKRVVLDYHLYHHHWFIPGHLLLTAVLSHLIKGQILALKAKPATTTTVSSLILLFQQHHRRSEDYNSSNTFQHRRGPWPIWNWTCNIRQYHKTN